MGSTEARLGEHELVAGYLRRSQARAAQSAEATTVAEEALREAQRLQAAAEKEAREADEQLQKLCKVWAGAPDAAMPDADAEKSTAETELAELRARVRRTEAERDAAHLAAGCSPPEPLAALSQEAEAELGARLAEAQRTFAEALANGRATAQQAGELAVLTAQADAARSKRRRLWADAASGDSSPRTPR